ncbi:hypothetical protein HDV00_004303 [Rhizophlyctis rosea]|nr:hypothetical protein HDV00_004303 [Rhizophlyctis rosea]
MLGVDGAMDAQTLYRLFEETQSPDRNVQMHAETQLKKFEAAPNFLTVLLTLIGNPQPNSAVPQAAAIYFKNRVVHGWDSPSNPKKIPVSQPDRQFVMQHLLQALARLPHSVRVQLIATLSTILQFEFREGHWPQFLPEVLTMVQSQDQQAVYAGLAAFQELAKLYQYKDNRDQINEIMAQFLPHLHAVAVRLIPSNEVEAGEMVRIVFKTYHKSIQMALSKFQGETANLVPWGTAFVQVVEKPLPMDMPGMPQDAEARELHPWWKAKKWAYACLNTLFSKYADTRSAVVKTTKKDHNNNFAAMFNEHFAPNILQAYLKQVEVCISGVWQSPRVKQKICVFLKDCVNRKSTWRLLKPHLEPLVGQFIFPLMCFSDEDQELWSDDSVEYIRKKLDDVLEEFRSPVAAAEDLLFALAESRKKVTFMPIIGMVNGILDRYNATPEAQRDPRQKDGALKMISILAELVLDDGSPIKDQIEQFLSVHVYPEFKSPHAFLRARACEVALCFDGLVYKNQEFLNHMFQAILQAMQDPELPVAVLAALAIKHFFDVASIFDAMKQHVQQIMQILLNLGNQVDLEALTAVIDDLVEKYATELAPFAVHLATSLRDTFMRLITEVNSAENDLEDGIEEKLGAAEGVLNTMYTLVIAMESSQAILLELEQTIYPVIENVFQNGVIDLYNGVVEIIEASTYCSKTISPTMWQIFELMYAALKNPNSDATDYIKEFSGCFDNFISYGKEVFLQSPAHQQKMFDIIGTVMTGSYERFSDEDRCRGAELVECMLLHLRGGIDAYIPQCLDVAFHYLQDTKKTSPRTFRERCLAIVINALYYNPAATLALLEQRHATTAFFELWFRNIEIFRRVHDKKLCIIALSAILELPMDQLPASLHGAHWVSLLHAALKVFETLPMAIAAREELEKVRDDEDNDVEEDDDEDASGLLNDVDDDDELEEDGDVLDEEDKYMIYLEAMKEAQAAKAGAEDADNEDLEELDEEDLTMETPLDGVDAFGRFEQTLAALNGRPDVAGLVGGALSAEQQMVVQMVVKTAGENRAKALAEAQKKAEGVKA